MASTTRRFLSRSMVASWKVCVSSFSSSASVQAPVAAPALRTAKGRSWKVMMGDFNKLAKGKLSLIVMTTSAAGFVLGSGESVDWAKFGWTCVGTWACSAAANTCNQIYEIRTDSFMKRTMLRPLPAGRLSSVTALGFAAVTGLGGAFILQTQVCSKHASYISVHNCTDKQLSWSKDDQQACAGQPSHSWAGGGEYRFVCFDIHSIEANTPFEYMGRGSCGGNSASDGMGSSHRHVGPGISVSGCCSVLLAVATLHGIGLALQGRLRSRGTSYDFVI